MIEGLLGSLGLSFRLLQDVLARRPGDNNEPPIWPIISADSIHPTNQSRASRATRKGSVSNSRWKDEKDDAVCRSRVPLATTIASEDDLQSKNNLLRSHCRGGVSVAPCGNPSRTTIDDHFRYVEWMLDQFNADALYCHCDTVAFSIIVRGLELGTQSILCYCWRLWHREDFKLPPENARYLFSTINFHICLLKKDPQQHLKPAGVHIFVEVFAFLFVWSMNMLKSVATKHQNQNGRLRHPDISILENKVSVELLLYVLCI